MNRKLLLWTIAFTAITLSYLYSPLPWRSHFPRGATTTPSSYPRGEDIFITVEELHSRLGDDNLVILDGNHPEGYAKGHIPGAINIGYTGLSRLAGPPGDHLWDTTLPLQQLYDRLASLGINDDSLVVAYSDILAGPGAGGHAVWQLQAAGFTGARLLFGGQQLWEDKGYPLTEETRAPLPKKTLHLSGFNEEQQATLEYLRQAKGRIPLLDVRTLDEFTGKDTSRGESRPGHITGAKWLEWKMLLTPDGTPRPPDHITLLLENMDIHTHDEFVVYSTMGIRSGFAALILRATGFTRVRNYEASIFEWAAVPELPMTSGM